MIGDRTIEILGVAEDVDMREEETEVEDFKIEVATKEAKEEEEGHWMKNPGSTSTGMLLVQHLTKLR